MYHSVSSGGWHRGATLGLPEPRHADRRPALHAVYRQMEVLLRLDARVPDLHELLIRELRLERLHQSRRGLARRVGDHVQLHRGDGHASSLDGWRHGGVRLGMAQAKPCGRAGRRPGWTPGQGRRGRTAPRLSHHPDVHGCVFSRLHHDTGSSRAFSRYLRPIFAVGFPSVSTMSPVKSLEPRISDEPTPYASTGTPLSSNSRIFASLKPPDATIRIRS